MDIIADYRISTEIVLNLMDISKQLKTEASKNNTLYVAQTIEEDESRFQDLWNLVLNAPYPINARASWVISVLIENNQKCLEIHHEKFVINIDLYKHRSVLRNMLKVISLINVPQIHHGIIYDRCINFLTDGFMPVAVKVYSMDILYKIAHGIPELQDELILIFQNEIDRNSVAFAAKARKLIKKMRK
ncbi:MAG: hypothetical protein Q8880_06255 [Bacteroidota bacterium]|nr:hypothetical protein [Bacteroidota bacterium]